MSIPRTLQWGKTGNDRHDSLFYEGQNGMAIMTGIEILHGRVINSKSREETPYVMLTPLSSRGTGRATMTVPISHLDEFISKLQDIQGKYRS